MQIITEKMPCMAKLDRSFKNLENVVALRDSSIKIWLAGGSILSAVTGEKINDYDIFSNKPQEVLEILKKREEYKETFSIPNRFSNFTDPFGNKIQIITRFSYEYADDIVSAFDFTVVCAAWDGEKLCVHDRFFQDIAARRLVINKLGWPMSTYERSLKYSRKGYKMCPFGMRDIAKAINETPIDWNNPDEAVLSFYPDGSPRFEGVD